MKERTEGFLEAVNKALEQMGKEQPTEDDIFTYKINEIKLTDQEDKIPNKLWCKKQGFEEGVKWALKYNNKIIKALKL